MKPPEVDWQRIHDIIEKHKGDKWGLIPLLQEVQEHTGYIPPEAIEPIAEAMNMHPAEVQGVITFYAGFALEPKGKYVLRVCRGDRLYRCGRDIPGMLLHFLKQGDQPPFVAFMLFDNVVNPVPINLWWFHTGASSISWW